jgi:hypothetical protein
MNTKKTRIASRYLSARPPVAVGPTWQVEHLDEYLDRGGRITIVAPGVSAHVGEWETLAGRIDNMAAPLCADVLTSSWTVGNTVAGTIAEYYEEQEQGNS